MSCQQLGISIADGAGGIVSIPYPAATGGYNIAISELDEGHASIRYADGHGERWQRWTKRRIEISCSGPAAPEGLWDLATDVLRWTLTIPDPTTDAGAPIIIQVLPIRPAHLRTRGETSAHAWTLSFEEA